MKAKIIGAICAAVISAVALVSVAAEQGKEGGVISVKASGIPHSALFGLSFDNGTGVAVGINGSVLTSKDGGETWESEKQDATNLALLSVARRGTHTIAVGQLGTVIVESTPATWKKVDAGTEARFLSVSVNTSGIAAAGGEFGLLLGSNDGGETWASIAPNWADYADANVPGTGEPTVYAVYVSEAGAITVAGEFGMILRRDPGSEKWRVLNPVTGGTPTIFALHIPEQANGNSYAVGQAGEILISTDNGARWFRNKAETSSNFLGVAVAPGGRVVVTGMRVMAASSNGGINWKFIEEGDTTTDWYQAVRTEKNTGQVMAVGHAGRIIRING